ncbi:MAG TPA: ATP-binding cassette domain-containing protein [Rhizomicrobium sp.]|nr:ATP-binding cassette domain-containing protein [Rhizomicrobium sp.]
MISAPAIALENVRLVLTSSAGAVNVLKAITLAIPQGDSVALLGPSGSGKSSLLMIAAGLEKPTAGRVTLAATDITDLDEDALARLRRGNVGIVFQSFHLIATMTALENVALPLEFARSDDAFAPARDMLKRVGLGARFDHYPSQLSGGEQQRVALARALVARPGVLFADEPTGNLDTETGAEVADLLFALTAESGTTLFLVTHEESLARRCRRIVRLRDGLIVSDSRT